MTITVVPERAVVPDPPFPIDTDPVAVTVHPFIGAMIGVENVPVAMLELP